MWCAFEDDNSNGLSSTVYGMARGDCSSLLADTVVVVVIVMYVLVHSTVVDWLTVGVFFYTLHPVSCCFASSCCCSCCCCLFSLLCRSVPVPHYTNIRCILLSRLGSFPSSYLRIPGAVPAPNKRGESVPDSPPCFGL